MKNPASRNPITMSDIGKRIKLLRQSNSWSQEHVASRLGITAPAFSKIESGFTDINFSRLEQIASLFEISVVELISPNDRETINLYDKEIREIKERLLARDNDVIALQNKIIKLLEK